MPSLVSSSDPEITEDGLASLESEDDRGPLSYTGFTLRTEKSHSICEAGPIPVLGANPMRGENIVKLALAITVCIHTLAPRVELSRLATRLAF